MGESKDPTEGLILELRRGILVMGVLSQLEEPQYGYSLVQRLAERGLEIEQSTLYPLLRRLEKQGLLESDWSVEGSRPRRYYHISDQGSETLTKLNEEWHRISSVVERLMEGDADNGDD